MSYIFIDEDKHNGFNKKVIAIEYKNLHDFNFRFGDLLIIVYCNNMEKCNSDFILKKEPNNRLISIDTNTNLNVPNDIDLSNNIQEIGGVLKKYYYFKKYRR